MALDEDEAWALAAVPDNLAESLGADMYSELTEAREFGSHIRIPRSVLRAGLPALTPEDFSRAVRVLPARNCYCAAMRLARVTRHSRHRALRGATPRLL